ncbi:hypothetical protein [Salinicola sp. MIT1003]|uniref:hypothetical protein n=1 Tax=Salinicola sp. MIT1003 TaxID=1882734 RepID=UPI001114C8D0|nr:hypothetical protein [Salinicola sp. MIT1003]
MKNQRGYALLLTMGIAVITLSLTIITFSDNIRKLTDAEREITISSAAQTASTFLEANIQAVSGIGWMPEGRITVEDLVARNVSLPGFPHILDQEVVAYYVVAQDQPKRVDLLITTEGKPNQGLLAKYGWQDDYSRFVRSVIDSKAIDLTVSGEPTGAIVGEIVNGKLEGRNGQDVDLSSFEGFLDESHSRIGIFVEAPNQLVDWTLFFGDLNWNSYQPSVSGNREAGDAWIHYTHSKPAFQNAGARLFCSNGLASVGIEEVTDGWVILPDDQHGICLESLSSTIRDNLTAKTYFQFLTSGSAISSRSPDPLGSSPELWGNKCHVVSANYGQKPLQVEVDCFDTSEIRTFTNPFLIEGLKASRIDSQVVANNHGYGGVYDSSYESGTESVTKRFMLDDYVTNNEFGDQCKKVIQFESITDSGIHYTCKTNDNGKLSDYFSFIPTEDFFPFHCAVLNIETISVGGNLGLDATCESAINVNHDFIIPSYIMVQSLATEISEDRYLYIYTVSGQMTTGTGVEGIRQSGFWVGKRGPSSKRVEISYDSGSGPAEMSLVVPFQYQ